MSSPVPSKPTQSCERFGYETGQPGIAPLTAPAAFEQVEQVLDRPGWIEIFEATIDLGAPPLVWLLVFDAQNAQVATARAFARYTYGPIVPGGTMVRAYEEWWMGAGGRTDFRGVPFDFGCVVFASTTPGLLTVAPPVMRLTARGQR